MKKLNRGEGMAEPIIILAVLIALVLLTPKTKDNGTVPGKTVSGSGVATGYNPGNFTTGATLTTTSTQRSYIALSTGNAAYVYQPYEEYITIENFGQEAIDITSWQLKNGQDTRPIYIGGSLQRFSSEIALIPQGALLLSPTGNSILQNIVLKPGERAVVTTGSVGVKSPYKITSFKENKCTGYIERLEEYTFTPPLYQMCPRPDMEPGFENIDVACRKFITSNIYSCQTPERSALDQDGESCNNCIKNTRLNNACLAYIESHYNYGSCVAYHQNDKDFYGNTWRIFLGRGWEMWDVDYETIDLFNQFGQLVSSQKY